MPSYVKANLAKIDCNIDYDEESTFLENSKSNKSFSNCQSTQKNVIDLKATFSSLCNEGIKWV